MGDHIDVFISSTSKDLMPYRQRLKDVVLSLGLHPVGMENFTPSQRKPVQVCYDEVQESEIFVGVYAYRYGFCPDKGVRYSAGECDGETSITQMEYQWALQKGIPMYLFLVHHEANWRMDMVEDEPGRTRLKQFKDHLSREHTVGFFTSVEDLATQVTIALAKHRPVQQVDTWRVLKPPLLLRQFVGRQNDIDAIQKSLANGGRVVIQGAGGMGKTTLVQHLGHTLNYAGGVLWAYLGSTTTPLPFIWERWKEVTPEGRAANAQDIQPVHMKRWLEQSPGPLLAIIDDVWDKNALAALLDALPDSTHVLVTTRDAGLAGGRAGKRYELHHLLPDDALSLLQSRLPDAPTDLLQKTAALLENHALALHLVTAYIEQNSIHDLPRLIERLERHRGGQNPFKELQLGESRDENLEVALFLSYDALDTDHQLAFRQLGVIPAGLDFSADMALGVWGIDKNDPDAVEAAEDRLSRLVRAGMVERTDAGRYDLHMLYHDYALALLLRQAEETLPRARYQTEVIKIAQKFLKLPPEKWQEDIEPDFGHIHERGNELVQAVKDWLKAQNAPPLAQFAGPQPLDFALQKEADLLQAVFDFAYTGIKDYVYRRSIGEEGRRWLEMGLLASRKLANRSAESLFLNELGLWLNVRGYKKSALAYYEAQLIIDRALENKKREATTLNNIGAVYDALGEKQKALDYYQQALPIHREVGNRSMEATTLNNIGLVYNALGEKAQALDCYQQALAIDQVVGDRRGEATTLNNIGGVYNALGETAKALVYYQQALPLRRAVGDRYGEAVTFYNMSFLVDTAQAIEYVTRARDLLRAVQSPDVALAESRLAELLG